MCVRMATHCTATDTTTAPLMEFGRGNSQKNPFVKVGQKLYTLANSANTTKSGCVLSCGDHPYNVIHAVLQKITISHFLFRVVGGL